MSKRILPLSEVREAFKEYVVHNDFYREVVITELILLIRQVETLTRRVTSLESTLQDWKRGGHP
jgi:hypothetical protein